MKKFLLFGILFLSIQWTVQAQDTTKTPSVIEPDPVPLYEPPLVENIEEYEIYKDKSEVRWVIQTLRGNQAGIIQLRSGRVFLKDGQLFTAIFNIDMTSVQISSMPPGIISMQALNYIRSKEFFDVYAYQSSILEIVNTKKVSPTRFDAEGYLTIKGVKKPITFTIDCETHDGIFEGTARDVPVNRDSYSIANSRAALSADINESINDLLQPQFVISVYVAAQEKKK